MAAGLDGEQARWLEEAAASITVASCDAAGASSLGQGLGLRFTSGGAKLRVFMVEGRSRAVTADLRAGRPIAVVFTHAPTLRSLQLKARSAQEVPLEPGDRELIAAYVDTVEQNWVYAPPGFVRTLLATEPGPLVAFELELGAAFDQTPGPKAGAALSGGER